MTPSGLFQVVAARGAATVIGKVVVVWNGSAGGATVA
jgi:hypothetical protein